MARSGNSVPFSSSKHSSGSAQRKQSSNNERKTSKTNRNRLLEAASDDGPKKRAKQQDGSSSSRGTKNEQDFEGLNVYDFQQAKVKNARTSDKRFELSREEAQLAGNKKRHGVQLDDDDSDDAGSDGGDNMASRIRKAALIIAGQSPLELDADDDEELDSDAAWNSDSDEARWGSVFNKDKKEKKKSRKQSTEMVEVCLAHSPTGRRAVILPLSGVQDETADLNVDLEESELEEEDDGMNDSEAEDEDDISEPSLVSDDEIDQDHEPSNDLEDFVSKLASTSSKRKVEGEEQTEAGSPVPETAAKRRRVLASAQGAGGREDAGDFGINSTNKLTLSSLVASDPSLQSTIQSLTKSQMAGPEQQNQSILKSGTLNAPLPTVALEKLAREAAYEQTSQEGAKWGAVMKRIKEAEQLKFPLQAGGPGGFGSSKERQRGGVKSGGDLMGGFQVGYMPQTTTRRG